MATLSNTAWDLSKTINQSTITVYQAATSDGLLDNFNRLVENVIGELREGIWRPLLPTVIILGAVWLAGTGSSASESPSPSRAPYGWWSLPPWVSGYSLTPGRSWDMRER